MQAKQSLKGKIKEFTHHLVSMFLLTSAIIIVSMAVLFTLVKEATPLLSHHHLTIQNWLSKRFKHPIELGSLQAGWKGFEPIIKVNHLTIENSEHQPIAKLAHFSVGINLKQTIIQHHLSVGLIAVQGVNVTLMHNPNQDTVIYAGFPTPLEVIHKKKVSKESFLSHLFAVKHIFLSNVNFTIKNNKGLESSFNNITAQMINSTNQSHTLWAQMSFDNQKDSKVSLNASFQGVIKQFENINGAMYLNVDNIPLANTFAWLNIHKLNGENGLLKGEYWAEIKKGKLASLQLKTQLENASFVYNNKSKHTITLSTLALNGWYKKTKQGFQIVANHIKDNRFLKLPANFYLNFTKDNGYEFYLNHSQISLLRELAKISQNKSINQLLGQYSINGNINDVYGTYQSSSQYNLGFTVSDLSLGKEFQTSSAQAFMLEHLNAKVYIAPHRGNIELFSNKLQMFVPNLVASDISFHPFVNSFFWQNNNNILTVNSASLTLANNDLALKGHLKFTLPLHNLSQTQAEIRLNIQDLQLNHLKNYLPKAPKNQTHLISFLNRAFINGVANIHVNIDGTLAKFPFTDMAANSNEGELKAKASFRNVTLLYKPKWPLIDKLTGKLSLDNAKLTINANKASTYEASLSSVKAVIPNIFDKLAPKIIVTSNVHSTLQQAKSFINHTPLKNDLGKKLSNIQLQGPMTLSLRLQAPLKPNTFHTQVAGSINTNGAEVDLTNLNLSLKKIKGQFNFDRHGYYAKHMTGYFFNEPLVLSIQQVNVGKAQQAEQFNFDSGITANTIQTLFPSQFTEALKGNSSLKAILKLTLDKNAYNALQVTSNLKGMESEIPAPFSKNKTSIKTLIALYEFKPNKPSVLTVTLGKTIKFTGKLTDSGSKEHLYSGHLVLGGGKATPEVKKGLYITGHINHFNWQKWQPYIIHSDNSKESKSSLRKVDLFVARINFLNYLFVRTQLSLQKSAKGWLLSTKGPGIEGQFNLPTQQNSRITANLNRLYLVKEQTPKEVKKQTMNPSSVPALSFTVNDFRLGTNALGSLDLVTDTNKQGIIIKNLTLNRSDYLFKATGFWTLLNGKNQAGLKGNLQANSLANILAMFAWHTNINANAVNLNFDLKWPNTLFNPSWKILNGSAQLKTNSGSITKIGNKANGEISTGELLTFLSLASLQKRLSLNFSDLNSKGYHFESLDGDLRFSNGEAWTTNTRIEGIVASIAMAGSINMLNNKLDVDTLITPHVTSSLPIIATLAGGPIVGAATYIVNKLVSPSVNKMAARSFRITGTLTDPIVKKLDRKRRG